MRPFGIRLVDLLVQVIGVGLGLGLGLGVGLGSGLGLGPSRYPLHLPLPLPMQEYEGSLTIFPHWSTAPLQPYPHTYPYS